MLPSNLAVSTVESADGARAIIALDGGHVVSWIPAGETENRLFVSAQSTFGPGRAIRGGIPVIFPQFGAFGSLRQHGFARVSRFDVATSTNPAIAQLTLSDSDETRALWPFAFDLEITVKISANVLSLTMTVRNAGDERLAFTSAFHPYFAVRDAYQCTVDGLSGCRYRDALANGEEFDETASQLAITGPLDRIYYSAPDRLVVVDGDRRLAVEKEGFPEAVVWNPGIEGVRSRTDFADGDERRMLCVEAARIELPVQLNPGEAWTATQRLIAE